MRYFLKHLDLILIAVVGFAINAFAQPIALEPAQEKKFQGKITERYFEGVQDTRSVRAKNVFRVYIKGEEYKFTSAGDGIKTATDTSIQLTGVRSLKINKYEDLESFLEMVASLNAKVERSRVKSKDYLYLKAGSKESFQELEHLFNHLMEDIWEYQNPIKEEFTQ